MNLCDIEEIQVDSNTQASLRDIIDYAIKMQELEFKDDYHEIVSLTLILLGAFPEN